MRLNQSKAISDTFGNNDIVGQAHNLEATLLALTIEHRITYRHTKDLTSWLDLQTIVDLLKVTIDRKSGLFFIPKHMTVSDLQSAVDLAEAVFNYQDDEVTQDSIDQLPF